MKKGNVGGQEKQEVVGKNLLRKKNDSLIFHFHHIHNVIFRLANKMIEASSVPVKIEQLPVLMTLYWLKEQSQQQVADHVNRDKSSVLRTVLALEKKGLVINKKDEKDGRKKVLTLTETGKFVAIQVNDLIDVVESKIIKALTDRPQEEFLESLKEATKRLEIVADS